MIVLYGKLQIRQECVAIILIQNPTKKGSKKLENNAQPHQEAISQAECVKLDHSYALPGDVGERLKKSDDMANMYAKRLYESNREKRKLENKIQDLESVLTACKTKCNISDESFEVLKSAASEVPRELLARAVKRSNALILQTIVLL